MNSSSATFVSADMSRHSSSRNTPTHRRKRRVVWLLIVCLVVAPNAGCRSFFWPAPTISTEHRAYYHRKVAEVDAATVAHPTVEGPQIYGPAPEIRGRLPEERLEDAVWPLTLFSAVRLGLEHNQVIRQDAQFLSPNNPIFNTIDANTSIYDPYIQDTNITFGNRGVGAAMADFQTQLTGSMQWGKDDQFNNVAGAAGDFTNSTRQFGVRLEKQLAFGGSFGLSQQINYSGTSNPSTALGSTYTGPLSADVTIPLWAASGTEFTQIAGPAAFLVPRVTSVNQGLLISQISSEVARIDLEAGIRGLVRDVVSLYWDLDLAYARVKTEQAAAQDARAVYDKAEAEFESGRSRAAEEAQSAETFYAAQSRLEEALRIYDETERRLRRLLGLPISDGRMIQPIDEPTLVDVPDHWNGMLAEALARRPQIRRSKHNLRSIQLQLKAARHLAKPRLDLVGSYSVEGFGDELAGDGDVIDSYYDRLTDRTLSGWTTGVQFSMPLGFRLQRSQVRNLELRVAKTRTQLAIAEGEIAHELAVRFQNAKRWSRIVGTNDNRRDAAARLVKSLEADFEYQRGDLDQLVRAQATLAQAEVEYRRALVEFRKAMAELDFSRSTLLEANHIDLVFSNISVAGNVNGSPRPIWADALPLGHHLPERLPMDVLTSDPAILPASTGGADGYSGRVGEVTTREVGKPLRIPGNTPETEAAPSPIDAESDEPIDDQTAHTIPGTHGAVELESPREVGPQLTPLSEIAVSSDDLPDLTARSLGPVSSVDDPGIESNVLPAAKWERASKPRFQPQLVPVPNEAESHPLPPPRWDDAEPVDEKNSARDENTTPDPSRPVRQANPDPFGGWK